MPTNNPQVPPIEILVKALGKIASNDPEENRQTADAIAIEALNIAGYLYAPNTTISKPGTRPDHTDEWRVMASDFDKLASAARHLRVLCKYKLPPGWYGELEDACKDIDSFFRDTQHTD